MKRRNFILNTGSAAMGGIFIQGLVPSNASGKNAPGKLHGDAKLAEGNKKNLTIAIGDRRELFVDAAIIERMDQVRLKSHEPVSGGVSIRIDRPWEGPTNGPRAVLKYGGRYLMYYRAMALVPGVDTGVLCVALSEDGITWTKPSLGLAVYKTLSDTNIVGDETGEAIMGTPWLDTGPGIPENERIKLIASQPLSGEKHTAYKDPKGPKRLVFWGSGDGFTFHKLDPQPDLVSNLRNCFDGGNTMFWSEVEQQYLLYYRFWDSKRTVARTTSKNLLEWTEPESMSYGNTSREHIYINNTLPYFRAPHIYVALAARFMQGRRVITEAQETAIGLKSFQGHLYNNDCSEGVLMTSRSGSTLYDRTFMEGFIRPGPGAQNWVSRTNYPMNGIFPYGQDRIMFWVSRNYMQDTWHIERLLLRLDGFVSVNAPYTGGGMLTKPFTFTGTELEINYSTGASGFVRVEIQDEAGIPIPGYTLADCPEIIGDEIKRIVAWNGGANIAQLEGKLVRLRFAMKDSDLYSFKFQL